MKTVYIVPHTHWDREWYFTNESSTVLLNKLLYDLASKPFTKFTLDGQISLLDDMLKYNPEYKQKINDLIKKKKLIIGPLYIQNDAFNVLAPTTQLNIDLTKKMMDGKQKISTMYMPDTFGFNEQLPQIFKANGFENFVFWRGIKPEDKEKAQLFYWKGIDGTKILSSCLTDGYYVLGQYYPYNQAIKNSTGGEFSKKLVEIVDKLNALVEQNVYFLPLGGDEGPLSYEITAILSKLNDEQKKYHFKVGTYDEFFQALKLSRQLDEIKYPLYYSGTSKIHRTIHSNRYDTKKLFRECELSLYYIMQPLELMYKSFGGILFSETYKETNVYKPLLKSSAHDSLGGCCSDETNNIVYTRLTRVKNTIDAYIDLMMNEINKNLAPNNEYLVYNIAPYKRNVSFKDIISTSTNAKIMINNKEYCVVDYAVNDLSFKVHDPVFDHHVYIDVKNMEPFSIKKIIFTNNENEMLNKKVNNQIKVQISGNFVEINYTNKKEKFSFLIEESEGDEYDHSVPQKQAISSIQTIKVVNEIQCGTIVFKQMQIALKYKGKLYSLMINLYFNGEVVDFDIYLNNTLKDARILLVFPKQEVLISRHLAFIDQKHENISQWQDKGYKDKPVHSYPHDGLVHLKTSTANLLTKGTNEVVLDDKFVGVVLARFCGFLGKPNLQDRPGAASGIPQQFKTPRAQLQKELFFNFRITFNNMIKAFNDWNFAGIGKQNHPINLVNKKLDKFIVNDVELNVANKVIYRLIDPTKTLIAYYKWENNKLKTMLANPTKNKIGVLKPYEIKYE